MAEGLLEVEGITIQFGGITALDNLTFSIEPTQICGLIGPNGAGKTTLFNVISRIYDPSEGKITFNGIDLLMIDEMNENTESTMVRLKAASRKMEDVIKKSGMRGQCCIIAVLTLILGVLVYLTFHS